MSTNTRFRAETGATDRETTVLGVRLAWDDGGSGPPVLCLHAVGHGARDFAPLRDRIGSRFRVIALDFPDQGSSGHDPGSVTAARYAELVHAFLDAERIESPIVVGNSIGGATAITLAAKAPGRVRAIAVANPGGLFHRSALAAVTTKAMARFFAWGAGGSPLYAPLFSAYYRRVLRAAPAAEQRARIVRAAFELAPLLSEAWEGFSRPESDLRGAAATVTMPVLVLWATKDPLNVLALNRGGIAEFPNAELRTFPVGHNPFLETPDEAAEAFLRFVSERVQ